MSRLLELGMKVRTKQGASYLIISEEPSEGEGAKSLLGSFDAYTKAQMLWWENGHSYFDDPQQNITHYWGQNENGTYTWLPLENKLF